MIIKQADARTHDIELLKHIKSLSHISREQAKRVEKELISIRSGLKGEREAAYHIDFHYGAGENYAIIHDLRLEHEGRVAQIDHLIIGRMLQTFLCETKYWSDGVSINEQGEFSAHYGQRKIGVPSPIMQNARHIKVLSSLLNSGQIERPKRLGMKLPFTLNPITLVSTGANIQRPEGLFPPIRYVVLPRGCLNCINRSKLTIGKNLGSILLDPLRETPPARQCLHTP